MTRILHRWPEDRIGELIADSPQVVWVYTPTSQLFGSMVSHYPHLSPVGWWLSRNIWHQDVDLTNEKLRLEELRQTQDPAAESPCAEVGTVKIGHLVVQPREIETRSTRARM